MPLFSRQGKPPRPAPVSQPPQPTIGSSTQLPHLGQQQLNQDKLGEQIQEIQTDTLAKVLPLVGGAAPAPALETPQFRSLDLNQNSDPNSRYSAALSGGALPNAPAGGFQRGGSKVGTESIAQAAYDAGFRGDNLVTATAVALAESSGNPGATGDTSLANAKWGPSVGLWQVRTLNAAPGGDFRNESFLRSGIGNQAAAAFNISGGGSNFRPWSVYTSGAYRKFLGQARGAVGGLS